MRGRMIACLIGAVLLAGPAVAQIPDNMPGLSFEKLKKTTIYRDPKGNLDPRFDSTDTPGLELFVEPGKKLSGSKMTTNCESQYDDGKGLILYSLTGGATSGKGTCKGDSFEWTAQSQVSGSRLVLSGRGTVTFASGESAEVTQQFTVVVTSNGCKLEAYNEKVIRRTIHPYFKTISTWTDQTVLDRATTCGLG